VKKACLQCTLLSRGSLLACTVVGLLAGGQHVARADSGCPHCGAVAVTDELHGIFERPTFLVVCMYVQF